MEFGPNYSPTFVIRLPMNTDEVTITIRDQTDTEVWEHEADLTGHYPEISLDMLERNRVQYSS